ncbi:UDP-Gal betaGal beta 1,3-galactosyltransferase, polypeptide 6 [Podila epigama]|nr:UDP-Gal betaGal beta 1,3-galactosyltransferase, polypeptide 6 [Podila epigama]
MSMYWAFLLTTALIQRLLQSYRAPLVAIRVTLAHLISWTITGLIVQARPPTEPTRPWVIITLFQALLLFIIVYLPWFKSHMESAGFPRIPEKLASHPLEDGFMGRDICGQSATRLLLMPLIVVGLCSWMLIITRGQQTGGIQENNISPPPFSDSTSSNFISTPQQSTDTLSTEQARGGDNRMYISMIILSSATPQGFRNRKLFRETTLKLFPSTRNKAVLVKYRFIIGDELSPAAEREIKMEHSRTGDLMMVPAPDTPDRKSLKLYKAIEWVNGHDFDYLVKTDDDVLVRMDILSGELFKQGKKPYFWKGLVFKNVPNIHLDDMDIKEMPKYTDGTLITLSRDIVRLLSVPAPRYLVENNGQALGVWLHGYGIQPIHDTRIQPGALICEEDLIAKHFDNEPSLSHQPRDDPLLMITRINQIRSELKRNKGNPNFRTSVSICDDRIQKRCAMCYSCQGRASNWKLLGFDCKANGIIVGDNYRRPEMLDAKQMDELVNRPKNGISDEIEVPTLKDYRPEARARQALQKQREEAERQRREQALKLEQEQEQRRIEKESRYSSEENGATKDGLIKEESTEDQGEGVLEHQDEDEALDEAERQEANGEYSEKDGGEEDEEEEESEEVEVEEGEGENDGTEEHDGDESDMSISDQEVDLLERHDDYVHPPPPQQQQRKHEKRVLRKKKSIRNV